MFLRYFIFQENGENYLTYTIVDENMPRGSYIEAMWAQYRFRQIPSRLDFISKPRRIWVSRILIKESVAFRNPFLYTISPQFYKAIPFLYRMRTLELGPPLPACVILQIFLKNSKHCAFFRFFFYINISIAQSNYNSTQ